MAPKWLSWEVLGGSSMRAGMRGPLFHGKVAKTYKYMFLRPDQKSATSEPELALNGKLVHGGALTRRATTSYRLESHCPASVSSKFVASAAEDAVSEECV